MLSLTLALTLSLATTALAAPTPQASASECTTLDEVLAGPGQPVTFRRYFAGSGVTESSSNLGNTEGVITETYDGDLPACSAAANCGAVAGQAEYESFDLHHLTSEDVWECKLYFDVNRDASQFSVANADVGEVYGYTL